MPTAIRYDLGYDDGYRAGLQKGRDAIASGQADALVLQRAETIIAPTRAELVRVKTALDEALMEVAENGSPAAFVDRVADVCSSITTS